MSFVINHWGHGPSKADIIQKDTGFCVGVELEIESIKNYGNLQENNTYDIVIDKDHSLRNNGHEFKTPPLSFDDAVKAFIDVHDKVAIGKDAFSDRTSIHVHVNCRDLEAVQLREIVLLYALLEPLYFNFVGEVRKNSIFCVPLNYTYLPDVYKKDITNMVKEWHKYTAFNIVPLGQFGTIEFRHLFGTGNTKIFVTWLNAIRDLFNFIREHKGFSILSILADGVSAADIAKTVCPTLTTGTSSTFLNDLLKNNLLDVKLASGGFYK